MKTNYQASIQRETLKSAKKSVFESARAKDKWIRSAQKRSSN